jgi:hypothetical protein
VTVVKAAVILNNNPEFHIHFETGSKLMVSYPFFALFFNVSDLENLKKELEHHNSILRGQIQSVKSFSRSYTLLKGMSKVFLIPEWLGTIT